MGIKGQHLALKGVLRESVILSQGAKSETERAESMCFRSIGVKGGTIIITLLALLRATYGTNV